MKRINILEDYGIVEIVSTGEWSLAEMEKERQHIARILKQKGFSKVLVDDRAVTAMPPFEEIYQFGAGFWGADLPPNIKVARIVKREMMANSKFLENVAVNRGTNVKTFEDMDTARQWLIE